LKYSINEDKPFTGKFVKYLGGDIKILEANYKNGKQHGLTTHWGGGFGPYPYTKSYEENYKEGMLHGLFTSYNATWSFYFLHR